MREQQFLEEYDVYWITMLVVHGWRRTYSDRWVHPEKKTTKQEKWEGYNIKYIDSDEWTTDQAISELMEELEKLEKVVE